MEEEDGMVQGLDAQGPRALCIEATTVTGSTPDTEDTLIGQQQWEAIRERHAGGQSISRIGRELELDRKTVRLCLQQHAWTPYLRKTKAPSVLDVHRQWLIERAPQVHYSARVLHQELRQRGFEGSYEIVKLAVRPLRADATVAALTQRRFETAPGEQAQVDHRDPKDRWPIEAVRIVGRELRRLRRLGNDRLRRGGGFHGSHGSSHLRFPSVEVSP